MTTPEVTRPAHHCNPGRRPSVVVQHTTPITVFADAAGHDRKKAPVHVTVTKKPATPIAAMLLVDSQTPAATNGVGEKSNHCCCLTGIRSPSARITIPINRHAAASRPQTSRLPRMSTGMTAV
ncbi:hypothetical protein ACHIPZ_07040 [Antrihabitans sp. NCIMB 15449]|uniref:Transposase n=1 Tax=Antrihabitans spumae TaxID=3373370 RepID=A0ABW7JJN5_9NOCA